MNRDPINDFKIYIIRSYSKNNHSLNYMGDLDIPNTIGVFVFNHGTALDGPIVNAVTDHLSNDCSSDNQIRYSKMLSGSDCLSFKEKIFFEIMNWIPIDRTDKSQTREAIPKMIDAYNKGYDMIIFPEATWNVSSELVKPFHKGVGEYSYQTNCPIIPCGVFRKNTKDYYINVGEVIYPNNYNSLWADYINLHIKELINNSDCRRKLLNNIYHDPFLKSKYKELIDILVYRINNINEEYNQEHVLEALSSTIRSINVKRRIDMFMKRYNEPNAFSDFFLDITLNGELKEEFEGYLKGKVSYEKLKKDLVDYITPIELTSTTEKVMASLCGNMMFDETLGNRISRKDCSPESLKNELLQEEHGFKLDYDKESELFHRKRKTYYNYILGERKDYISEEEVFENIQKLVRK